MRKFSWTTMAMVWLLLPVVIGCGDGIERISVSGSVTYDGQPVEEGVIRFQPQQGTNAPVVIERIKNGKYKTPKGKGIRPGSYRIEIRAYDPNVPEPIGPTSPPRPQLLPEKYNAQSTLELTISSGSGSCVKNFDLTK